MMRYCPYNTATDCAPRVWSVWLTPLALLLALWALAPGSAPSSGDSTWLSAATVQPGNVAEVDFGESSEDLPATVHARLQPAAANGHAPRSLTLNPYLSPLWHEQAPRAPPALV